MNNCNVILLVLIIVLIYFIKNNKNCYTSIEKYGSGNNNGVYIYTSSGWKYYQNYYSSKYGWLIDINTNAFYNTYVNLLNANKNMNNNILTPNNNIQRVSVSNPNVDIFIGDNISGDIKIPSTYYYPLDLTGNSIIFINNGNMLLDYIRLNNLNNYLRTKKTITWKDAFEALKQRDLSLKVSQILKDRPQLSNKSNINNIINDINTKLKSKLNIPTTSTLIDNNVSYDSNYTLTSQQKQLLKPINDIILASYSLTDGNSDLLNNFIETNARMLDAIQSLPPDDINNILSNSQLPLTTTPTTPTTTTTPTTPTSTTTILKSPQPLKNVDVNNDVMCGIDNNYNIYCSDNTTVPNWKQLPGALQQVSVNNSRVYGTNSNHNIYTLNNYNSGQNWNYINNGQLKQIELDNNQICGTNNVDQIWCANSSLSDNLSSPSWRSIPGSLRHLSLNSNKIYGVNSSGMLWTLNDTATRNWINVKPPTLNSGEKVVQVNLNNDRVCVVTNQSNVYCANQNIYSPISSNISPNWNKLPYNLNNVSIDGSTLYGVDKNGAVNKINLF
jgi:hypothetical protein